MSAAHDPLYIEFVTRLRNARKSKGISQTAFGELIGKEQSFVSKVETCERRLDVIEAARWCAALNLRLADALPAEIRKLSEE
ncbi:MAG: helix-turn-helix transcriptional regulator [Thermoguttaceae bacterium]|jgi:transcriptional regulator with XRE-family HTH domain